MLTAIFLIVFGGILVGFMAYLTMFRKGRKNQAPQSEVNAQDHMSTPGRSTGRGND